MLRFGLCCLFKDEAVSFWTTTVKALSTFPRDRQLAKLSEICRLIASARPMAGTRPPFMSRCPWGLLPVAIWPRRWGCAMGMYNSCIYLGMMIGSTIMGITLKRVGYPLGFAAAAGSVAFVTLMIFLIMMQTKQLRR